MLPALLVAAFLAAHALIHAGFLSARPATPGGPEWPFELDRSRLLDRLGLGASAGHAVGRALFLVLLAGYGTAVAAIAGLVGGSAFVPGVAVGSVASLALLAVFFHRWLIVGVVLDVLLLVALAAGWTVPPLG